MSNYLAKVSGDRIDGPGVPLASIRLDTPAWFSWLAEATTRSFSYPITDRARGYISVYVTVRKEHRPRGGDYLWAYRRGQGRVRKTYLGRTERVTMLQLETAAGALTTTEPPPL